jgi:ribosomal protein L40E
MCWGIECGDGWYWLIDELCAELWIKDPDLQIVQIKEKCGTLRFYVESASPEQFAIIDFAENLSSVICEKCGQMGATKTKMATLCEKCKKELEGVNL